MDEEEYKTKYDNLRILKSIQDYLKSENKTTTSVYPINVPEDMLFRFLKVNGPEGTDKLIHHIFRIGLTVWCERLYIESFGDTDSLKEFIEIVKERVKKES